MIDRIAAVWHLLRYGHEPDWFAVDYNYWGHPIYECYLCYTPNMPMPVSG